MQQTAKMIQGLWQYSQSLTEWQLFVLYLSGYQVISRQEQKCGALIISTTNKGKTETCLQHLAGYFSLLSVHVSDWLHP